MTDDTWHMYLITLATRDGVARRPAIRHLFFAGYTVDEIVEFTDVDIAEVRDALNRIP